MTQRHLGDGAMTNGSASVGRLLSPAEAAARLGVSAERVRQLARAGKLDFVPTALGRLIDPEAVERLQVERERRGRRRGRRVV